MIIKTARNYNVVKVFKQNINLIWIIRYGVLIKIIMLRLYLAVYCYIIQLYVIYFERSDEYNDFKVCFIINKSLVLNSEGNIKLNLVDYLVQK